MGEELSFHYPYGTGDVKKCIETLETYAKEQGKEFQMYCVTPEEFEELDHEERMKRRIAYLVSAFSANCPINDIKYLIRDDIMLM